MSKMVWLKCKQVVEYNQQVRLSDKEYETLQEALEEDNTIYEPLTRVNKSAYSIIEGHIDHTQVYDNEREYTDVEIEGDSDEENEIEDDEE